MSARRPLLEWQDEARCAVEVGKRFDRLHLSEQRAVCDRCPVTAACLLDALEWELPLGRNQIQHLPDTVYGGWALDDRIQLEERVLGADSPRHAAELLERWVDGDLDPQQLRRVIDAAGETRRNTAGGSKSRAA